MRTLEEIKGRCFIDEDGHWVWRGACRPDGRPNIHAPDFTRGGMQTQCGTRAVWHVAHQKPVPAGYRVYGVCGLKACCNPDHLRCTSEADFGRWIRRAGLFKGQTNRILANRATSRARAVLTPEVIAHIQASTKSGKDLAIELGISPQSVSKARRGETIAYQPAAGLFSGLIQHQGRGA